MKIGVNTWVWSSPLTTSEFELLAPRVAAMGFDLIEVPLERLGELDYPRVRTVAADLRLEISVAAVMAMDRDLIHPDSTLRENGLRYLERCIDATSEMGATNLVGPMYSATGRTWHADRDGRERDLDLLVPRLRALAARAADQGVVLCIEPLNRFETSFINLADQAVELVDRVDSPACGILLDTFHMNIEERSLGEAIRRTGTRLRHLHACENDRGAPGSGHIPWQEVASALRAIGFAGPVVIESFTSQVQSIARAAAIWRALAPSQDALAAEGLRYLRELFRGRR